MLAAAVPITSGNVMSIPTLHSIPAPAQEQLMECKHLSESEVKQLTEMAREILAEETQCINV